MTKFCVYVHTFPNGKKYVGATIQAPKARWARGRGYSAPNIKNPILEYGWDNITHEVWELTSLSEMYYAEKYLIAFYQTTNPRYGYNRSLGGKAGRKGVELSEKERSQISVSLKGRAHPYNKGKKWSQEAKDRNKGIRSCPWKGSHHSWGKKTFPKYVYLLPDGTEKVLTLQNASKYYIRKGINIIRLKDALI